MGVADGSGLTKCQSEQGGTMPTVNKVTMVPVQSTNIQAVGFDLERSILVVQFSAGKTYEYSNVTAGVYMQLAIADSIGSAFNEIIRSHPETYPYKEI
jgi:hypothetical protein